MSKHLMSPNGGENATPDRVNMPKVRAIGGTHGNGPRFNGDGETVKVNQRPQYCSPTPDKMGNLFGHKRNDHGV